MQAPPITPLSDDHQNVDLLREAAFILRRGKAMGSAFEGRAPTRCDPEGEPAWEYEIAFNPETGLYHLETTRPASLGRRTKGWTYYVDVPATLYEPAEVGWRGSEWEDHVSPVLAEVFRKLEWEGLPLPL